MFACVWVWIHVPSYPRKKDILISRCYDVWATLVKDEFLSESLLVSNISFHSSLSLPSSSQDEQLLKFGKLLHAARNTATASTAATAAVPR